MIQANNFIKGLNVNNKESKQTAFKGNVLIRNEQGTPTDVKFFMPGTLQDNGTKVQYYNLDPSGKIIPETLKEKELNFDQNGFMSATVKLDPSNPRLGYNFIDPNNKILEELTEKRGNAYITIDPRIAEFKQPRNIIHLMEDSYNVDSSGNALKNGQVNWRDHFKLYGANIQGITAKVPELQKLGITSVMGTPLFGFDNLSCHGYWTENNFRIAPKLGTMKDFDDLNIELFKHGMRWIADGAYVNQGLQGFLFQDVIRRAAKNEASPIKEWFDFHAPFGTNFNMPLLPHDDSLSTTNKVKNDSYKVSYTNMKHMPDGKTINNDYDASKPSYLNLLPVNPEKTHNRSWDSVQKYSLPISPDYHKTKELPFKLTTIVDPNGSSYETWDGNCDTVKLAIQKVQIKNGIVKKHLDTDLPIPLKDGNEFVVNKDVKEYIVRAAEYWTTKVDNTLITYATNLIHDKLSNKGFDINNPSSSELQNVLKELIKEKKLPESVSHLSENDISNAIQNTTIKLKKLEIDEKGKIKVDKEYTNLAEMLPSFPLQSLYLPNEAIAVFSYPHFKKHLARTEFQDRLNTKVNDIIDKMQNKEMIKNPEIARLVYQDLAKSIFTKALTNYDLLPDQPDTKDLPKQVENAYYQKMIDDKCDFLNLNVDEAANKLAINLAEGLSDVKSEKIAKSLDSMVEKLNSPIARVAKLIITEAECGLDWRLDASKDVARIYNFKKELENLEREKSIKGYNERTNYEKMEAIYKPYFNLINDFWGDFGKTTKMINPKASIIGEVTDVPWQLEEETLGKLCNKDGMTTTTDYHFMFGSVSEFVHTHSEESAIRTPSDYLNYAVKTRAKIYPHSALTTAQVPLDNHDKTRVLHNYIINPTKMGDTDQNSHETMINTLQSALCASNNDFLSRKILPQDYINENPQSNFAVLYKAIDSVGKKIGKDFAYWPIERILPEIRTEALNSNKSLKQEDLIPLTQGLSKELFKDSSIKALRAFMIMVGSPGAPTLYAGDELRMTGGSTGRYNQIVQNRNPVYIDGKPFFESLAKEYQVDYSKEDIYNFYNKTKSIFSIRTNPAARVLNTGFVKPIEAIDNKGVLVTMRYDDKDMALFLQTNGKIDWSTADNHKFGSYAGNHQMTQKEIEELDLKDLDRKGIKIGTVFYNARNNQEQFIVWKDGSLRQKPDNVFEESGMIRFETQNGGNPPKKVGLTGDNAIGMILIRDKNALANAISSGKTTVDPIAQPEVDDFGMIVAFKGKSSINKLV